jgi:outer membrane lipoprotein-sorting protein
MNPLRSFLSLLLLTAGTSAQQPSLDTTLAKLDAASAKFTSAQATFVNEDFTYVVKDTTTQKGIIYTQRKGGETDMGIKVEGTGARIVQYKNGNLKDFNPAINCYDAVDASKSKSTIDSFLTLAFGTSGKALAAAWNIDDKGSETLTSDGKPVKVEKLVLTPKDPGVRNNVTQITLWMDLERGVSLKLIFNAPSRDTHTATYSNIRLNQKVDTAPFEIKAKPCK